MDSLTIVDLIIATLLLVVGLIGALVETKPENGKLNKYGWVVIVCLVSIFIGGVIAKFIENNSKAEKEVAEQIEKDKRDSLQRGFQTLVIDSLHKSIVALADLNNSYSKTFDSISKIANTQQKTLMVANKIFKPLFPYSVWFEFEILDPFLEDNTPVNIRNEWTEYKKTIIKTYGDESDYYFSPSKMELPELRGLNSFLMKFIISSTIVIELKYQNSLQNITSKPDIVILCNPLNEKYGKSLLNSNSENDNFEMYYDFQSKSFHCKTNMTSLMFRRSYSDRISSSTDLGSSYIRILNKTNYLNTRIKPQSISFTTADENNLEYGTEFTDQDVVKFSWHDLPNSKKNEVRTQNRMFLFNIDTNQTTTFYHQKLSKW